MLFGEQSGWTVNPSSFATDEEVKVFEVLAQQLMHKRAVNGRKQSFYDATYQPDNLGIAIPRDLAVQVNSSIGWGKTVVDTLHERLDLQGFTADREGSVADDLYYSNDLQNTSSQVHLAALIYGTSFALVGANPDGLPLITFESPMTSTGLWNRRTRQLDYGMVYTPGLDDSIVVNLYQRNKTLTFEAAPNTTRFSLVDIDVHNRGMPLFQFVNGDALDSIGRSEITNSIENILNLASASILFMHINQEMYSFPQRYILGGDPADFKDPVTGEMRDPLKVRMDMIFMMQAAEDGSLPNVGNFNTNMGTEYINQLDAFAGYLASEAGIPLTYFGVSSQQATSAEAIARLETRLARRAEIRQRVFSAPWSGVINCARRFMGADKVEIHPSWRSTSSVSLSASADAVSKLVGSQVIPPNSQIIPSLLGLSRSQTLALQREAERGEDMRNLKALLTPTMTNALQTKPVPDEHNH